MSFPPSTPEQRRSFIQSQTTLAKPPLTPEIQLHLATEITPIWEATEATLEANNLPPPYWAFAWPGGQALTRFLLDNADRVKGKRVLDFAAGSGLSAIGAKMAGAERVAANEIDDFAIEAILLNAAANKTALEVLRHDLIGQNEGWDVVLAGDGMLREADGGPGDSLVAVPGWIGRHRADGRSGARLSAGAGGSWKSRRTTCRPRRSWKTASCASPRVLRLMP